MKTILFSVAALLLLNSSAFADCLYYAGLYELVPGTSTSNSCDDGSGIPGNSDACFTFPSDAFKIVQNGCDDIQLQTYETITLTFSADRSSLVGQKDSLGRTQTTTLTRIADGSLNLDYTQVSSFLGSWAKTSEYTATFKKLQ